jgi:protocatechuate 3,4-dioxygenase beta subunit
LQNTPVLIEGFRVQAPLKTASVQGESVDVRAPAECHRQIVETVQPAPPSLYNRSVRSFALSLFFAASLVFCAGAALAAERVTAVGKVLDADGNAIEHAGVLVYSAGVKKGFSLFCPTCYVDCGKRAFTGADGTYSIAGLSPDLVFNFLIVREGYNVTVVNSIDPKKGPVETAVLKKRTSPGNPAQIVRGKVVDRQGTPVRDALVEPQGTISGQSRSFTARGWINPIAVTNDYGEFEIAYGKPLDAARVKVSPRGMAPKLVTVSSGPDRQTITVTEGAIIRGRLLQQGKPFAQAEMGLSSHSRHAEEYFPEVRIGTNEDGRFTITNIPPRRVWYLYAKMEALAPHGLSAEVIECATKDDGQDVNVGDIQVKPAYTLRGKIVLSDGKLIPSDMRLSLFSDQVPDSQTLVLAPDGLFEFRGLARGVYSLSPSVKGYEVRDTESSELLIEGDVSNLAVLLQPATPVKR